MQWLITARIAGAAAGGVAAAFLYAAPAAAAGTVAVPCHSAALASAIGDAASGETLSLAANCTYPLTAALPAIGQDLTIVGNHATLSRSDAPATPKFTILSVDAGTLSVTGLNFSNGAGAIAGTDAGSISVSGGRFTGNHATNGGAIYSSTGPGSLSVTDAAFVRNSATQAGGAIYTSEAAALTTVAGSRFTENTAGTMGGAIYNFFDMNVSNSTFDANKADDGGAIFNNGQDGDSLTDVTVRGNTATQDGGGVVTWECALSVTDSRISANHAGSEGGGLYQYLLAGYPDGLTMTGTRVLTNTANNGAGVYTNDAVMNLSSSTISGNSATADGGGVYNDGAVPAFGNINLSSSTVSSNTAGTDGGGLYNTQGTVDAAGTPIEHNTAGAGGGIYDGPGPDTVTLTNSPVQGNTPDNCEPAGTITGCPGTGADVAPQAAAYGGSEAVRRHAVPRLSQNGSLVAG